MSQGEQIGDIADANPVVRVEGLYKSYNSPGLLSQGTRVQALDDVSFTLNKGEVVALVGESGSGKSTIARQLIRLETPDEGDMVVSGTRFSGRTKGEVSLEYRQRVQMIFQDPFGSLNPVHKIGHHLMRPLMRHRITDNVKVARDKAIELLEGVGLAPGTEYIDRFPYELSGGQRQRVAIARALAVEPEVIIADEPTSMLDVSIRVDVLNLLERLRSEHGVSLLFITHDLVSARYLADRILVMYCGRIVEEGPAERILSNPRHPYTRLLLSSTPEAGSALGELREEETPASDRRPVWNGCAFQERCEHAMECCVDLPQWLEDGEGRGRVFCHEEPQRPGNGGTLPCL